MRTLSFMLAAVVGFACWGLTLALSGGVAPLGKIGAGEGACFFVPILILAAPLGVLALVHGYALTSVWIAALAPILGFINFAFAVSARFAAGAPAPTAATVDQPPPTFALVWGLLLAVILAGMAATRWLREQVHKTGQAPT